MLQKFKEGISFGAGFSIVFIAIWYLADVALSPSLLEYKLMKANNRIESINYDSEFLGKADSEDSAYINNDEFYDLSPEEQIEKSTVIVLAGYKHASNNEMIPVISQIIKKSPETEFYYDVGDEYPGMRHSISKHGLHGDGMLMFFTGSPAMFKQSVTYRNNRLSAFGDMPLELFKQKCEASGA